MATMYQRKSRLTARQQSKLIEQFVAGTTARAAAELVGIQPNTAIRFFKGKRGRGAAGKVAVFGLLKRGGKVYTAIIPNARTQTLLPIIEEKVEPDSIVYTDTFKAYNALDVSDFHHMCINNSELFADRQNHINGIENFWNQAKRHLRKFNGIKQEDFYWFLKECEWRFNGGNHKDLLTQLKY
jgi:transposase